MSAVQPAPQFATTLKARAQSRISLASHAPPRADQKRFCAKVVACARACTTLDPKALAQQRSTLQALLTQERLLSRGALEEHLRCKGSCCVPAQ
eukprot:3076206-Pleurochrysis_carterae.AAC.1